MMANWAHIRRAGIAMIGAFTTGLGISGLVGCGLLGHNESRYDVDKIVREIEQKHEGQQQAKSANIPTPVTAAPIPENAPANADAEAAARAALDDKIQALKQKAEPPKTELVASTDDVEQKYEAWKASQAKELLAKQVKDAMESRSEYEASKKLPVEIADAAADVEPTAVVAEPEHSTAALEESPKVTAVESDVPSEPVVDSTTAEPVEPLLTPEESPISPPSDTAPTTPPVVAAEPPAPVELPITSSIGSPEVSVSMAPIETHSASATESPSTPSGDLVQRAEFARKAAELAKKKAELAKEEAELAEKMAEFAELAAKPSAAPTTMMAVPEPPPVTPGESAPATKADSEQLPAPSGAATTACDKTQTIAEQSPSTRAIVIHAEFREVEKKVLVAAEHVEIQQVPAEFEWVDVKVETEPEQKVARVIPAVYEDVSEPIIDQAEQVVLVKDAAGNLVKEHRAATYKLVTRRVLKSPERVENTVIPARYETIKKQIVKRAAEQRRILVPAQFRTVLVKELVKAEEVRYVATASQAGDDATAVTPGELTKSCVNASFALPQHAEVSGAGDAESESSGNDGRAAPPDRPSVSELQGQGANPRPGNVPSTAAPLSAASNTTTATPGASLKPLINAQISSAPDLVAPEIHSAQPRPQFIQHTPKSV